MLAWLNANKEWLFSGAGAVFAAWIFGLTKWLRREVTPPPQVIVRVEGAPAPPAQAAQLASAVRIERIAPITAEDIHSAITNALPLQEAAVKKSFIGLKIEWDTLLQGAEEEDGVVHLFLKATSEPFFSIWCNVKLVDYRELGIMPRDSRIRVYGEIEKAEEWSVRLKGVELKYLEKKE